MGLTGDDVEVLARLDFSQLCRQAEGLVSKRWHEVSERIPKTLASLPASGEDLFRFYAQSSWPEGHHRHERDALEFLQFLVRNNIVVPDRKELKRLRQWGRS